MTRQCLNRRPNRSPNRRGTRRAFSLVELLLAAFILGIGVISIAAIFPAGIAQQRQSNDDLVGPLVAENAMALLRTKLRPEYFGAAEDFQRLAIDFPVAGGTVSSLFNSMEGFSPTVPGDWGWQRPWIDPTNDDPPNDGNVRVFDTSRFKPWNLRLFPHPQPGFLPPGAVSLLPPPVVITQNERLYPSPSDYGTNANPQPPTPQYAWDFMVRRFEGRPQVAIFVYRIGRPGGQSVNGYTTRGLGATTLPSIPVSLNLVADPQTGAMPPTYSADGAWNAYGLTTTSLKDDVFVRGTAAGTVDNLNDDRQAWQIPGQWIIDQNGFVYRVAARKRSGIGAAAEVQLASPPKRLPGAFATVPPISGTTSYLGSPLSYLGPVDPATGWVEQDVVTQIYYVPREIDVDGNGTVDFQLTPVFATVREL